MHPPAHPAPPIARPVAGPVGPIQGRAGITEQSSSVPTVSTGDLVGERLGRSVAGEPACEASNSPCPPSTPVTPPKRRFLCKPIQKRKTRVACDSMHASSTLLPARKQREVHDFHVPCLAFVFASVCKRGVRAEGCCKQEALHPNSNAMVEHPERPSALRLSSLWMHARPERVRFLHPTFSKQCLALPQVAAEPDYVNDG